MVLDLGSRRLLGYQMSDRIDTQLVAEALSEHRRSLQQPGVATTD